GCTTVFVPEDLNFMHTTAEAITTANPRLLPLVAHDRATFGGMLLSSGIAMAWSAWRGYKPGRSWMWFMYLAAGLPAYICAIGVHIVVGYHDWWHLTPAIAGSSIWGMGLALSYRYLCDRYEPAAQAKEWPLLALLTTVVLLFPTGDSHLC